MTLKHIGKDLIMISFIIKIIFTLLVLFIMGLSIWVITLIVRRYKVEFSLDDLRNDGEDKMQFKAFGLRNNQKPHFIEESFTIIIGYYAFLIYGYFGKEQKPLTKTEAYEALNRCGMSDKEIDREFPNLQNLPDDSEDK